LSQYYFTVSSLPLLLFDAELTLTAESFIGLCKDQLPPSSFSEFENAIKLEGKMQIKTAEMWRLWVQSLTCELARLRAQKLGWDFEVLFEMPYFQSTEATARESFNEESPLLAEEILNRARWNYLEELEIGHYFDLEKLIIYYFKLVLLNGKSLLTRSNGQDQYELQYKKIPEEYIREEPEIAYDER
jgi:hypothetical protein